MPLLFGITLFLSAVLLFLIQPMIARMILPLLGGSPAVWLTCMLFFQTMLLAGYTYAHGLASRLPVRRQLLVHLAVLAAPMVALPLVSLPLHLARETVPFFGAAVGTWLGEPPLEGTPIPWLLGLLLAAVGLPFFAVSASAPLLQRWLGSTPHEAARDPYFLYAASNAGSMVALLGYPFAVEPLLPLLPQTWLWAGGYLLLLILTGACAASVWRAGQGRAGEQVTPSPRHPATPPPRHLTTLRRLRWLALSFVGSSLLFGVTTYLSTDIAAVPLLWIVPLALYLLTFILAFAPRRLVSHRYIALALPPLLVVQLFVLFLTLHNIHLTLGWLVGLHLLTFFVAALTCHGELAEDRPATEHLTEFYLWLSVGGVLGGAFNALLAPQLFASVAEYPLVLLVACLLGPQPKMAGMAPVRPAKKGKRVQAQGRSTTELLGLLLPFILGTVGGILFVLVAFQYAGFDRDKGFLMLGLPLVCYALTWAFSPQPLWFGLPVGVLLLTGVTGLATLGTLVHGERGFYGILRVTIDPDEKFVQLFHGSTMHGKQHITDDPVKRREPLTYYHREGPIGQVFAEFSGERAKQRVGLVGLGTGSLASYGEAGQEFVFYEIDPAVVRIARDSDQFSFLKDSRAKVRIVFGDARLSLKRADDGAYGLLVLDAFSSDAIPVHLLTREVMEEVYLRKLTADGVLAFHISNRYLDLRPLLAALARTLNLAGRIHADLLGDELAGRAPSAWVLLARTEAAFGKLAGDSRWEPLPSEPSVPVWTDDYSNILHVLRW